MIKQKIKMQSMLPRIDGIQKDLQILQSLSKLPFDQFCEEINFSRAQFYLRQTLEGVFNIGSHILSRLPGRRATEYKEVALKLGETGIIDKKFSETSLKNMAGYRNRLTHFYADITPEEIYNIIKEHLNDFDIYLNMIKDLLENPSRFDLEIE